MTSTQQPIANTPRNREEIEQFLYYESHLIDKGELEEWHGLFTEDAIYWVPSNRETVNTSLEASIIWDNWARIGERAWRLQSGLAHTTDPASKTRHMVTNVMLGEVAGNEITVYSNLTLFHLRRGEQRVYAAHCEHRLRVMDGSWKIVLKKVDLLTNNEVLASLQFII